jgi:hypothetical protein
MKAKDLNFDDFKISLTDEVINILTAYSTN